MQSDDELARHIERAFADALSDLSKTLASITVPMLNLTEQWLTAGHSQIEDAYVSLLLPEQREIYQALRACGTPMFDALNEARELADL